MAVVIYFSSVVSVLYYYGIIQYFFLKIARIMNLLMGTSPSESIISVASVFLGTVEAPLLIKPLIPILTDSELFAIMVTACASTSGSILAAYIGFGIRADHLVTASLLSAPSSLAIAKTLFPETKRTKADWDAIKNVKVM
jgi:pyrimidine nucleoside transport protein